LPDKKIYIFCYFLNEIQENKNNQLVNYSDVCDIKFKKIFFFV